MKIKYSWIPFIPIAILSVFLRVYQVMFVNSGVDNQFLNNQSFWWIYAALVALLVLFLLIFSASDRITSGFYRIGKNFFAGIFALITGVLLFFGAMIEVTEVVKGTLGIGVLADVLFSVLGGIAFAIMGLSSLSGGNKTKGIKVLMVLPAVWSCVRLITVFMDYKTKSVHSMDMTDIVFMALATLFIFNVSMVYAGIKGRNPVKATFVYGMPAIVVTFAYSAVYMVTKITSGEDFAMFSPNAESNFANINTIQFLCIALFAIFFLIELTSKAQPKTAEVTQAEQEQYTVPPQEGVFAEKTEREDFSDVGDKVKEELSKVNNVIADIDKEENNPDKASPLSDEFLSGYKDRASAEPAEEDLDKINQLIKELEQEDNE